MADPFPIVRLRAQAGEGPRFLEAQVAPSRGMLLLQARVRLSNGRDFDLLKTPPPEAIAAKFGGPEDFNGNVSFSLGGAILLPYANRIRGRPVGRRG